MRVPQHTLAIPVALALFAALALSTGCDSGLRQSQPGGDSQPAPAASTPAATPQPGQTDTSQAQPTPTPASATTTAPQQPAAEGAPAYMTAQWRHRDGTNALLEFAEPRRLRLETTELTLTTDGDVVLAVFPDMEAYAMFDAPRTYTFDAFADLSPVLEPPLLSYSGKPIPTGVDSEVEGWRRVEGAIDAGRFSTEPPRFHRDITSQVARPVGQYAALRLEGQPAPYFEVSDLNGSTVTLADFEGQAMLIDFWATWCPPCLESMPKLDDLDRRYGNNGLTVLGMNMDEGSNAARMARQFVANHGFGFRQALADGAAGDFNVEVLPTLFLLDRDHTIRAVYIGLPPDSDTLAREVEMALR